MSLASGWLKAQFSGRRLPPFSFIYGGRPSSDLLTEWKRGSEEQPPEGSCRRRAVHYDDPATRLKVTCEITSFEIYPAVEWVLHFENNGSDDSPILEDIQALDTVLIRPDRSDVGQRFEKAVSEPWDNPSPEEELSFNEFFLHHWRGAMARTEDFTPGRTMLPVNCKYSLFSLGGRSSSGDDTSSWDGSLPFFNVEAVDHGALFAVGWTGQWRAEFERDLERNLAIRAGMDLTHLKLHPGERIRTPSILIFFWKNDRLAGYNKFRQFILDHHTPQQNDKPLQLPLASNAWFAFRYGNDVDEQNQIEYARLIKEKGISLDYFWIDAGWYGKKEWGADVGDWFPKQSAFPRGLKPVADAVRELGMGFFLWYEPERVRRNTQLWNEHPEWLLMPDEEEPEQAILDLGNREARDWMTDLVSGMIDELGMDVYRQDMNCHPLEYWRHADAPDRQGMTEIRHIEGLYAFWDELRRRHPNLIIDNCATGARRLDLECMSRSITLWRCDHTEPAAVHGHGFALAFLYPATSGVCHYVNRCDPYVVRSAFSNGLVLAVDVRRPDFHQAQVLKLIEEFRTVQPLYYGDFYPLTAHSTSQTAWLGYQLHRHDLRRGAVLVFRRRQSPFTVGRFKLRGLMAKAKYEMTDADTGEKRVHTGRKLMSSLTIRIPKAESSVLLTYRETNG